jgi:hypothetical protein
MQNCAAGRPGFACQPLHKTATFQRPIDTNSTVYTRFSELFEVPIDEMELWTSWNQFAPFARFENNVTSLVYCYDKTMFLRRRPAGNRPKSLATYFLKFFHPSLTFPLQYIGSINESSDGDLESLFPVVCRILHFPAATKFRVFEEASSSVRRLNYLPIATVATLIFELEPGTPLPSTDFPWTTTQPISEPEIAISDEFGSLPTITFSRRHNQTVETFLTGTITAVVFAFADPTTALSRVRFPACLSVESLAEFVADSIDLHTDELVLLYKDAPSKSYLSPLIDDEIAYQFPTNQKL